MYHFQSLGQHLIIKHMTMTGMKYLKSNSLVYMKSINGLSSIHIRFCHQWGFSQV